MLGVLESELDRGRFTQACANFNITKTQPNSCWPSDLASVPPDLSNLVERIPNHVSFTLYKKMATLSGPLAKLLLLWEQKTCLETQIPTAASSGQNLKDGNLTRLFVVELNIEVYS